VNLPGEALEIINSNNKYYINVQGTYASRILQQLDPKS